MDIDKRLESLDRGQTEILRRIDKITGELEDLKVTVRQTVVEIGGVPDEIGRDPNRKSIRARLHEFETEKATAEAATAALAAAKQLHDQAGRERFTKREKIAALLLAAIVAIGPYIAPLIH